MTSQPSSKRLLRERASDRTSYTEAIGILHNIHKNPSPAADRALVIQGTAMIERALEIAIRGHLRKDIEPNEVAKLFSFHSNGPLANFGARIQLAYALGEYGLETLGDLKTISEIRNAFAHSAKPIDFTFEPVITLCANIKLWQRGFFVSEEPPSAPREQFIRSVAQINTALTVRIKVGNRAAATEGKVKEAGLIITRRLLP